jgi:hypothetical protein
MMLNVSRRAHQPHLFRTRNQNGDVNFLAQFFAQSNALGEMQHRADAGGIIIRARRCVADIQKNEREGSEYKKNAKDGD